MPVLQKEQRGGLATVTSNGGVRYVPNERHIPEVLDQALCLEGADSEAASGLVRETDSSYKPPYSILKQGILRRAATPRKVSVSPLL
jgi:hypothetical protein